MTDAQPEPQPAPADERPQEAQRHLPAIVTELAHQAMDGAVKGAAGYAVMKGLDKLRGGEKPPVDPPGGDAAAEAEPGDDPPPLPWPG